MESGKQQFGSLGGRGGGVGGVGAGVEDVESEPSFSMSSSLSSSPSPSVSSFALPSASPGVPPLPQHARSASFSFATPSSPFFGSGLIRSGSQPGDLSLKSSMALAAGGAHPLQERIPSFRNTVGGPGAATRTISPPIARPSSSPPQPPSLSSSYSFPDPLLGSVSGSGSVPGSGGFLGSKSFSAGHLEYAEARAGGAGSAPPPQSFARSGPPPFRRMSSQDVAPTLDGLRQLARQGSWRGIVEKVKEAHKFLMFHPPDEALAFSAYHVLALMKLRMFGAAADELRSLGDLDDPKYRYESYPEIYYGKRGSLVPFSLRWLYAELPHRLSNTQGTIDRLYDLLARCNAQIDVLQHKKESPWVRRMSGVIAGLSDVASPQTTAGMDYPRGLPSRLIQATSTSQGGMHVRSRSSPPVFAKFSITAAADFPANERGPSPLSNDSSASAMPTTTLRRERKSSRSMTPPKVSPSPSTASQSCHDSGYLGEPKGGIPGQPGASQSPNNTDSAATQASGMPSSAASELLRVSSTQDEKGALREKGEAAEGGEMASATNAVRLHQRSLSGGSNDFGEFVSALSDSSEGDSSSAGNGLQRKESTYPRERTAVKGGEAAGQTDAVSGREGTEGSLLLSSEEEGSRAEENGELSSCPVSNTLRKELSLDDGIAQEISRAVEDAGLTSENGAENSDQDWIDGDARDDQATGSPANDSKEGLKRRFLDQWMKRQEIVLFSIINHHLAHKDFLVALKWLKRMLRARPREPVMLSKYGYVRLQMGDVEGARIVFARVEQLLADIAVQNSAGAAGSFNREGEGDQGLDNHEGEANGSPPDDLVATLPPALQALLCRNRGLLMFAMKQYGAAVREFDEALAIDTTDVVSVVNKAICLMYSRDLMGAVRVLEEALQGNPVGMLNETLVLNLCSIYNLASAKDADTKRMLSAWIMRCAPDDFDVMCTQI